MISLSRALTALRRPITEAEAHALALRRVGPLILEPAKAARALRESRGLRAALPHLGRACAATVRGGLALDWNWLSVRLVIGSEAERTAICSGLLTAGAELGKQL